MFTESHQHGHPAYNVFDYVVIDIFFTTNERFMTTSRESIAIRFCDVTSIHFIVKTYCRFTIDTIPRENVLRGIVSMVSHELVKHSDSDRTFEWPFQHFINWTLHYYKMDQMTAHFAVAFGLYGNRLTFFSSIWLLR